MEILQFILSLFKDNALLNNLAPILELLKKNNFDIKSTLADLDPATLQPLIQQLSTLFNNKSPTSSVGQENALAPILDIADKDIVYTLNKVLY